MATCDYSAGNGGRTQPKTDAGPIIILRLMVQRHDIISTFIEKFYLSEFNVRFSVGGVKTDF